MKTNIHRKVTNCECLDFIEATYRDRVYPLIYCHLTVKDGHLDIEKLKDAISISTRYIPELLYIYDYNQAHFIERGLTARHCIITDKADSEKKMRWDLSNDTQLKIFICQEAEREIVVIGISHILTDGIGFLQYLYLLAALYNGKQFDNSMRNTRDISPLLKNIQVQRQTQQTKYGKKFSATSLFTAQAGHHYICLTSLINADCLKAIHAKTKRHGATLNEAFMTAYIRVIAHRQNTRKVVIPCPADLRRFNQTAGLTVANMTGVYKTVVTEIEPEHTFSMTLKQVSIEMALQKSRRRCFAGIKFLACMFRKTPLPLLRRIIKMTYHLPAISYTNFGIIDHNQLSFKNCRIEHCYLTGTYRNAADFQLSVSTFHNICTLNCTLVGTEETRTLGQNLLEQVKKELIDWSKDN